MIFSRDESADNGGRVIIVNDLKSAQSRRASWATSTLLLIAASMPAVDAPPTIRVGAASNPTTVTTTTSATLSVSATDDSPVSQLIYSWSAPAGVTFSSNGTNAARRTTATFSGPGTYDISVHVVDAAGNSVMSSTTVEVESHVKSLTISPTSVTLNPDRSQQFSSKAKDQFGVVITPPLTWTRTGVGSVAANGKFDAGATPGAATVTVAAEAKTAKATIRVNAPPTVNQDVATPTPQVTGKTALFSVRGADDVAISGMTYRWSATKVNGKSVSFSPNNSNRAQDTKATFAAAGSYVVTATIVDKQGLSATSTQTVEVLATPTSMSISPTTVTLNPSQAKQFTAKVLDQFKAALATQPTLVWSATGGTVSTAGSYVAGAAAGQYTVVAGLGSTLSTNATVRINGGPGVVQEARAVVGASTIVLSVLGSDDTGESLLKYSWASNVRGVVFSGATQSTNAAKAITATVPANGVYTFTATIRDPQGKTTTSRVTISYPNLPPSTNPLDVTTDEDVAVELAPLASDPEDLPLAWSVVSGPSAGSLVGFNPTTGAATYVPNLNATGVDSVTLAVSDGLSSTNLLVSLTINPVNDAPVLANLETGLGWFRDGDAALPLGNALTASDIDSLDLAGATLRIVANFQAGDTLAFTNQGGITGSWDMTSGTLTLAGSAPVASYQAALRSVRYSTSEAFPGTAARTVSLTVNDGVADSNTVSRTIGVVTRSAAPWVEGFDGLTAGADLHQLELAGQTRWHGWDANPAATATVSAAQARSGANSVAIAGATDLVHEYKGIDAGGWSYSAWQYVPAGFTGKTYFILLNTYKDNDAARNWSTQVYFNGGNNRVHSDFDNAETALIKGRWVALRVDIDFAADRQRFFYDGVQLYEKSWTKGTTGTGLRNLAAVDLYANGTGPVYYDDLALSPIVPSLSGSGSVAYVEDAAPVPVLPALAVDGFGVAQLTGAVAQISGNHRAGQDRLGATLQAGLSAAWDDASGTLTLSGVATPAAYQAVLRSVAYDNTSQAPDVAQRTVSVTVTAASGTSNVVTATVDVTPVNDLPVPTLLALSGSEDTVLTGQATATDVDGGALVWSLVTQPAHGLATVDASGAVDYTPEPDFNGDDAFTIAVSDGLGSVSQQVQVTVDPGDDPAVVTVPGAGSATPSSDLVLTGFAVTDLDSPTVSMTVAVGAGTISLPALAGSGATLSTGSGLGDTTVTIDGTPAAVTAALAQVVWRAPAAAGITSLDLAANGGHAAVPLVAADPAPPIGVAPLAATSWSSPPHGTRVLPYAASFWTLSVPAAGAGRYHLWIKGGPGQVAIALDGADAGSIQLPGNSGWSCTLGSAVVTLDLSSGPHDLSLGGVAPEALQLVAETPAGTLHEQPLVAGPGGVTVIEAEDYDTVTGASDGSSWLPVTQQGRAAVVALPDVGRVQAPGGRAMTYDVWFTAPGTYRMWVRGMGGPLSDSMNVTLDGATVSQGLAFDNYPVSTTRLSWGSYSSTLVRADIAVASAGLHRIAVSFREDGVMLDQIALAAVGWVPADQAVPAALRQGLFAQDGTGVLSLPVNQTHQLAPGRYQHAWLDSGGFLQAMPDIGVTRGAADWPFAPGAWWQVRFATAGRHTVHVLGAGPDGAGNSVHVGLAGPATTAADLNLPQAGIDAPAWSKLRTNGTVAYIDVPAPGDYAIGLWMREDGVSVRQIVIQPEGQPAPTGDGPPASVVAPVGPSGPG